MKVRVVYYADEKQIFEEEINVVPPKVIGGSVKPIDTLIRLMQSLEDSNESISVTQTKEYTTTFTTYGHSTNKEDGFLMKEISGPTLDEAINKFMHWYNT